MDKKTPGRTPFTWEEAARLFPNARATFKGGDLETYSVSWSYASLGSSEVDGILALPAKPTKSGYLYYNGSWRKL